MTKEDQYLSELRRTDFWQTRTRGSDQDEYEIYLKCATDLGWSNIKTFEEWLNS